MARTPVNYAHDTQLSTAALTIIGPTVAGTKDIVRKLSFYNTGTTARTVTVYVVETGGTAGTANTLMTKGIAGGEAWNCIEIQAEVFLPGMSLQLAQDTGTDVNTNCSGTLVT